MTQASTRLSAQQAEEAAQTALNVMAEYPLCFSPWTSSSTPVCGPCIPPPLCGGEQSLRYLLPGIHPLQDYFAADTANPSAAVFWNCSFSGSTGHQLDLILDDETGKMLAFSYRIPATNTAEAAFSMEDAVQMRQFCQQYYNLDAAQFSALLPLYPPPPGYLLPFTDQKGGASQLESANQSNLRVQLFPGKMGFLLSFLSMVPASDAVLMSKCGVLEGAPWYLFLTNCEVKIPCKRTAFSFPWGCWPLFRSD